MSMCLGGVSFTLFCLNTPRLSNTIKNPSRSISSYIKRIGIFNTHRQNINSEHRKMCHANNESRKRHLKDKMELINQDKIWTLGEKETYKYIWILEADTIKQEMKEKN